MTTYTHPSELEYLNKGDIVVIGGHTGVVEDTYIKFHDSNLGHLDTCKAFHDIHELAHAIYNDTSTIRSSQGFPTFTNPHDATAIVRELMLRYNNVEPLPTSVSSSEKMMSEPTTEKKKSRIVFSKIL